MPRFRFVFTYDISYYTDFVIEAGNEDTARKIASEALAADEFARVEGRADYDSCGKGRVSFVKEVVSDDYIPTMQEVIDEANKSD